MTLPPDWFSEEPVETADHELDMAEEGFDIGHGEVAVGAAETRPLRKNRSYAAT
jgi:hypothetical protein